MGIENMKAAAPNFYTDYPYKGIHSAINVTFKQEFLTMFPVGLYENKAMWSDGEKDFLQLVALYEMT
jgi:hypothetical protein